MRRFASPIRRFALASLVLFGALLALAFLKTLTGWGWLSWPLSSLCHQDDERCFVINGAAMALCARCLGIYSGIFLGSLIAFVSTERLRFSFGWILAALTVNAADWLLESMGVYANLRMARLLAGALLGFSLAGFILPRVVSPTKHDRP